MPQDAYTLRFAAKELDEALRGGHINKINQPSREEVSLAVYVQGRVRTLTLSANASACGAYFLGEERENPPVAPGFCMLLRKYLQGAEILSVRMLGFERILLFTMRCSSDFTVCERVLCAEIMGKYSNLLLLEDGNILGALKTTSLDGSTKRLIFPGVQYVPPVPQDKADPSDFSSLQARLHHFEGDLGAFLFRTVAGLAPSTADAIASRYRGGDLATFVYDEIFHAPASPCVVMQEGVPTDFCARGTGVPFPSLLDAEQFYYGFRRREKMRGSLKRTLLSVLSDRIKKHEKRLAAILEKRLACGGLEKERRFGDILTANLYRLERGMRSCTLPDFYDEGGKEVTIPLDVRLSPSENAQAYYKRYAKQKRTLANLQPQEEEVRAELDYLLTLRAAAESAEDLLDLRSVQEELQEAGLLKREENMGRGRKKREEISFRTYELNGWKILAGRNNLQNDRLVRASSPDDLWLHAQRYHSCHTVIKSEGKPVPEEVLRFAAAVCARFSDAGGDAIPVDCCPIRHVRHPHGAKAGFVTYHDFTTVLGDPSLLDGYAKSS